MTRRRLSLASLVAASAFGLVTTTAGVASAGQVIGCAHNNYCFSYSAGGHGAATSFTDLSLNLSGYAFPYNGTGGGDPVAGDSHWAADYSTTRSLYVFTNSNCSGGYDTLFPGTSENLSGEVVNNNYSYCTY